VKVIILQIFRLLAQEKQDRLASMEKSRNISSVRCIREFLMSENPNDLHFFISCLECVDVTLWAGTTPESSVVLEEKHFGRIMQLLDSLDLTIFRKVCATDLKKP
jgi:AP-4 complex subunit epsilon-1